MHADDKEIILQEIYGDIYLTKDFLNKVLNEVKDNDVSNYPIIVLSQKEIVLGVKIVDKEDFDLNWNFNISHLEEFVIKGIVLKEKAKEFIKVYKEHSNHYCLFVTFDESNADFIYVKK